MFFSKKKLIGMLLISSFVYAQNMNNIEKKTNLLVNKKQEKVPVLILDKNSTAAQIILKSQEEYLKLLKKRIKISNINEEAIQQIQENNCEINKIKIVLAKLIKEVELLKKEKASKEELKEIYKYIDKIKKENKLLKKKINAQHIKKEKLIKTKIDYISQFISKKYKNKKICRVIKIPVYKTKYSIKDIENSYIKYKDLKKFTAQANLTQYNYPLLWAKTDKYPVIKKGVKFEADMWTYAGWVHVKNQGWVRGFLLYPKVLQKKVQISKKPVKYIEKMICNPTTK